MFLVLEKLNYGNIKKRVHSIGMEFDLDATHNDTKELVICECKAREDPVPTTDIELLVAKLVHEDIGITLTEGMFFSTSGFIGTAAKWYETLPDPQKQRLKLYDANAIIAILRQNDLILSDDKYEGVVRKHTQYQLGDRHVVYYDSHLYIVQTLRTGGAASHFMILTNDGELVNKQIEDAIIKLDVDLRLLSRIDIIQEKVILALLDSDCQTTSQLSGALDESERNVAITLDELTTNGMVKKVQKDDTDLFTLSESIDTLTALVRRFANNDKKYQIMSSKYLEKVTSDIYARFVVDRFKLELDQDLTNMLIKASQIFPSVLQYLLLGDNTPYLNSHRHLEELRKSGGDHSQLAELTRSLFFHEIAIRVLTDARTLDSNYLGKKKGIKGFYTKTIFKIASEEHLIMSIHTEGTVYLATVGGPIQAGSFVSASNVSLFLNIANTLRCLELFDQAIREYDKVTGSTGVSSDILAAAWNNKGVCYKALNKCKEAIDCYNEALKIDENLIVVLGNLAVCYQELGEKDKAEEVKIKIEKIRSAK